MAIRIVRLGSPRGEHEGLRIGTVRRPPRGVPKEEFAIRDYYDVWLPNLAPSAELMTQGRAAATEAQWKHFERAYRKEMSAPLPTSSTCLRRCRIRARFRWAVIARMRRTVIAACCASSCWSGAHCSMPSPF